MRGLKKSHGKRTYRYMDIATTKKNRPRGRFNEYQEGLEPSFLAQSACAVSGAREGRQRQVEKHGNLAGGEGQASTDLDIQQPGLGDLM